MKIYPGRKRNLKELFKEGDIIYVKKIKNN